MISNFDRKFGNKSMMGGVGTWIDKHDGRGGTWIDYEHNVLLTGQPRKTWRNLRIRKSLTSRLCESVR